MQVSQEKRIENNPRLEQTFPVTLSTGLIHFEGETMNLSNGGFAARSSCLPEVGDTFSCKIESFGDPSNSINTCKVIWTKPDEQNLFGEIGFQFLNTYHKHKAFQKEKNSSQPTLSEQSTFFAEPESAPNELLNINELEKQLHAWINDRTFQIQAEGGVNLFFGYTNNIRLEQNEKSCSLILEPKGWETSLKPSSSEESKLHSQLLENTKNLLEKTHDVSARVTQINTPTLKEKDSQTTTNSTQVTHAKNSTQQLILVRFLQNIKTQLPSFDVLSLKRKIKQWASKKNQLLKTKMTENFLVLQSVYLYSKKSLAQHTRTLKKFFLAFISNYAPTTFLSPKTTKTKKRAKTQKGRVQNIRQARSSSPTSFLKIITLGTLTGALIYTASQFVIENEISEPQSKESNHQPLSDPLSQAASQSDNAPNEKQASVVDPFAIKAIQTRMNPLLFGPTVYSGDVKNPMSFELRLSNKPSQVMGFWDGKVLTITLSDALSFDKAGPIAQAHPWVQKASILNYGDYSVLKLHFENEDSTTFETSAFKISAKNEFLKIYLEQPSFVKSQGISDLLEG